MNNTKLITFFLPLILILVACNSGPQVIEGQSVSGNAMTPNTLPSLAEGNAPSADASAVHQVVVEEVLSTDKYNYLYVQEKDQKYWMAISRMDVKAGETYFYRGGLLKKNFFSREFNRVFETVYLVSEIWGQDHSVPKAPMASAAPHGAMTPSLEVGKVELAEGAISLKELIANKQTYDNQRVRVTGKCVKANPRIMNRNWIHLQDGSGEGLDLTVTTSENISLGAVVTMEGTISLDKDFGAGYQYDIIMEGASVIASK